MRFVTFETADRPARLGLALGEDILDLTAIATDDPRARSMVALAQAGEAGLALARAAYERGQSGDGSLAPNRLPAAEVRLLAPIPRPVKNVYCVGLNYRSHVEQNAAALDEEPVIPDVPLFFSKPVSAVVGPGAAINLDDRLTAKLDYEVELTIVIGRGGTWIDEADAASHILGYTIVNDVSARDLQWRSSQFLYGKGQDTYCPMGPAIVTPDELPDLDDVEVELLVNGETRQRESAGHMIFRPARVVSELSKGITLEPGDVITLGTPGGCGYQMIPPNFLQVGDTVECRATGVGSLVNHVVAYPGA